VGFGLASEIAVCRKIPDFHIKIGGAVFHCPSKVVETSQLEDLFHAASHETGSVLGITHK
jgi:hypothetical protein